MHNLMCDLHLQMLPKLTLPTLSLLQTLTETVKKEEHSWMCARDILGFVWKSSQTTKPKLCGLWPTWNLDMHRSGPPRFSAGSTSLRHAWSKRRPGAEVKNQARREGNKRELSFKLLHLTEPSVTSRDVKAKISKLGMSELQGDA